MRLTEEKSQVKERSFPLLQPGKWLGSGLLLVIVVLFYWKLVLTDQFTWLEGPDFANQVLPWFQFQASQWRLHHFPLWDPSSWAGQPLLGQALPGAAAPLNWLLFLAPLKNGFIRFTAMHWYYVLIHYLAALNCYALCRVLGRSRMASLAGASAFALGGFVGAVDWPQMLNGAVWAPLVLLFFFRSEQGEQPLKNALLSGFFLGVTWLSGHHQVSIFLTLTLVALWIWVIFRERRLDYRAAKLAAVCLAIAVLASGLQTIPTAEYGIRSVRWVGSSQPLPFGVTVPYSIHEQYSLKPIDLFGIFLPTMQGHPWNPFIGVAGCVLAGLGGILAWNERRVRILAAVAAGGIVFALGPNSLLNGVVYAIVPLVEKARSPAAATILFALGISPLVAYGIDRIPLARNSVWLKRTSWMLVGCAAFFSIVSLVFFAARIAPAITDDRMMIAALSAFAMAALLAGWRTGKISARGGAVAAVGLVLFELANVSTYWLASYGENPIRDAYLLNLSAHDDLVRFVRSRGSGGRILYDGNEVPYNLGDWYGVETLNGYLAGLTQNVWDAQVFMTPMQDLLSVRYYFGKTPIRAGQKELFQGRSGLKVFENPTAYPRIWSVHQSIRVADQKQVQVRLLDPTFDARQTVLLSDPSAQELAPCDGRLDQVSMTRHEADRVVIAANMACPGMVILSDTWFPGWRVTVDGQTAKIEQAYGLVRGVLVGAGPHILVMRYLPASFLVGASMTLCAIVMVFFVSWRVSRYKNA